LPAPFVQKTSLASGPTQHYVAFDLHDLSANGKLWIRITILCKILVLQ